MGGWRLTLIIVTLTMLHTATADIYVSPSGQDDLWCGNSTSPCQSIQAGVDRCDASPCNIQLMRGVYNTPRDTWVNLPPAISLTGIDGIEFTKIDYSDAGANYGLYAASVSDIHLQGVHFYNYTAVQKNNSLIRIVEESSPFRLQIDLCLFDALASPQVESSYNSVLDDLASVIYLHDTESLEVIINNSTFANNRNVIVRGTGRVSLTDSVFTNNTNTLINLLRSQLNFTRVEMHGNEATSALVTLDGRCHLDMDACLVTHSRVQSFLFIGIVPNPYQRSVFILKNSMFANNNEGVYTLNVNGASGFIENCTFKDNGVSSLYLINTNAAVRNSTFSDNKSAFPQVTVFVSDDGISSTKYYYLNFSQCVFNDNVAQSSGGAIRISSTVNNGRMHVGINETNVIGNSGARFGGGIFLDGNVTLWLRNSNVSYNQASMDGGGIYCTSAGGKGEIVFANSTLYDNKAHDDDDQFYNEPRSRCRFSCLNPDDTICTQLGNIPPKSSILPALAFMVVCEGFAMIAFHIFCWRAAKRSISRFGYQNLL